MIELAGVVVVEEGKILLLHRKDEQHWEVPGGKVEEEESPTDTAVREAREEIGVEVQLKKPFYSGEFQHSSKLFLWHGYIAEIEEGEPEIREEKFSDLKWLDADMLNEKELAPNLRQIKPALERVLD